MQMDFTTNLLAIKY